MFPSPWDVDEGGDASASEHRSLIERPLVLIKDIHRSGCRMRGVLHTDGEFISCKARTPRVLGLAVVLQGKSYSLTTISAVPSEVES